MFKIPKTKAERDELLREAEALRSADGAFKDDAAREAFDARMEAIEAFDKQPAPPAGPTAEEIRAAEVARINGITAAVRTAKLPVQFGARLVADNVTLDKARELIFAELTRIDAERDTRGTHATVTLGEDERQSFLRGAMNWLIVKAGLARTIGQVEKVDPSSYDPGEFRGMTLLDLARHCLDRAGVKTRGLDKMALVSLAFTKRDVTQSTSDFSTLLENVMHKVLQASYAIAPETWSKWCARGSVSDFRAHNRYRMGAFGALDALTQEGEFKHKAISDAEKGSITAATKGNIITVSRQMIVNDDLGAFSRLLSMLGRAAALSVEVDAYALLGENSGLGPTQSDSQPLFHSNRANVNSTGSALSAAGIDADAVVMASQTDPWGNEYLDLRPAVLLVPRSLEGTGKVVNESQYDPDTVANKAQMKPNIVRGIFRDVVGSPRLTGTRRYLFADPAIAPVFEVAFLEGQESPVLETKDGWTTDGTEMRVRFDYGVAAIDHRGAVTNAGA